MVDHFMVKGRPNEALKAFYHGIFEGSVYDKPFYENFLDK